MQHHEVPRLLRSATKAQLLSVMAELNGDLSTEHGTEAAVIFTKTALQAAVELHDSHGPCGLFARSLTVYSAFVQRAASELEASTLLPRLMANAPPSLRDYFPDFENEVRNALDRPLAELRGGCARLEATYNEHEAIRLKAQNRSVEEEAALVNEGEALGFAVSAMYEVVHAKSAAAIAAVVARTIDSSLPTATSARDTHEGKPEPSEPRMEATETNGVPCTPPTITSPYNATVRVSAKGTPRGKDQDAVRLLSIPHENFHLLFI
ncbi:MAG: hypothetical protein SGPRY_000671 [Prymnesium sp.]